MLPPKVPPVYVPVKRSTVELPGSAAEAGKTIITEAEAPGCTSPRGDGTGDPPVLPRIAPVKVTFCAVPVPLFFTVTSAW
jgi:hypothetical protein